MLAGEKSGYKPPFLWRVVWAGVGWEKEARRSGEGEEEMDYILEQAFGFLLFLWAIVLLARNIGKTDSQAFGITMGLVLGPAFWTTVHWLIRTIASNR